MHRGYVKIHRKLREWEWYANVPVKVLFLHLLLCANHDDGSWQGHEVKRGQFLTGRNKLSEETGLTERQIRTALDKLKQTGEITQKTTSKFSVITICNYEDYQTKKEESDQQTTSKRPASDQQTTTNKNDKNVKNEKKKTLYGDHVFLTEEENQKLIDRFGEMDTLGRITKLDNYIGSKGTKYKSHYHTILNWANKDAPPPVAATHKPDPLDALYLKTLEAHRG